MSIKGWMDKQNVTYYDAKSSANEALTQGLYTMSSESQTQKILYDFTYTKYLD